MISLALVPICLLSAVMLSIMNSPLVRLFPHGPVYLFFFFSCHVLPLSISSPPYVFPRR